MILPYRSVPAWCHQGNPEDSFGLCAYAMLGNLMLIQGGDLMPDVEIESAARAIEGFDEWIAATDTGVQLEVLFRYVQQNGWPGDPSRVIQWSPASFDAIPSVIASRGGCAAALALPMGIDGGYDFSDAALERGAPGVYGHAVALVEPGTFITWGEPRQVSEAWMRAYGRGFYDVVWVEEV